MVVPVIILGSVNTNMPLQVEAQPALELPGNRRYKMLDIGRKCYYSASSNGVPRGVQFWR